MRAVIPLPRKFAAAPLIWRDLGGANHSAVRGCAIWLNHVHRPRWIPHAALHPRWIWIFPVDLVAKLRRYGYDFYAIDRRGTPVLSMPMRRPEGERATYYAGSDGMVWRSAANNGRSQFRSDDCARTSQRSPPANEPTIMPRSLKLALGKTFARAGLEIRRSRPEWEALRFLRGRAIRTVLDIGANEGQFVAWARALWPDCSVHAFEPLPGPFRQLEILSQRVSRLHAYRFALGDCDEERLMQPFAFTPSSSLLPPTDHLIQSYPHLQRRTPATMVLVRRLDSWAEERDLESEIFLKIDVQGYEQRMIAGATAILRRATAVMIEVSFAQLYQGQGQFEATHDLLVQLGYHCAGMTGNSVHRESGRILEADAIYVR